MIGLIGRQICLRLSETAPTAQPHAPSEPLVMSTLVEPAVGQQGIEPELGGKKFDHGADLCRDEPTRRVDGMDREAGWLEFLQDDSDLATREFILLEQPDRNDADAEPAEDPFPHPLGIVGEIAPLHRDYDLT